MSPGGHLVTTAVAAGVGLAATGSVPFAAGIVVGGFLIDVDHAVDYLIVERQRELTPAAFLRYYTEGRADRKSTRLNSSHQIISYAVFCLKKKNRPRPIPPQPPNPITTTPYLRIPRPSDPRAIRRTQATTSIRTQSTHATTAERQSSKSSP